MELFAPVLDDPDPLHGEAAEDDAFTMAATPRSFSTNEKLRELEERSHSERSARQADAEAEEEQKRGAAISQLAEHHASRTAKTAEVFAAQAQAEHPHTQALNEANPWRTVCECCLYPTNSWPHWPPLT